jgi:hypothetical protein
MERVGYRQHYPSPSGALLDYHTVGGPVAQEHALPIRQAVWSRKVQPTFAEAIAVVRQHWWTSTHFYMSPAKPDMVDIPSALLNRLTEPLCYAA